MQGHLCVMGAKLTVAIIRVCTLSEFTVGDLSTRLISNTPFWLADHARAIYHVSRFKCASRERWLVSGGQFSISVRPCIEEIHIPPSNFCLCFRMHLLSCPGVSRPRRERQSHKTVS